MIISGHAGGGSGKHGGQLKPALSDATCLMAASFVFYGIACLTWLMHFATLFTTFEEHMYYTSCVRQVAPPDIWQHEEDSCVALPRRPRLPRFPSGSRGKMWRNVAVRGPSNQRRAGAKPPDALFQEAYICASVGSATRDCNSKPEAPNFHAELIPVQSPFLREPYVCYFPPLGSSGAARPKVPPGRLSLLVLHLIVSYSIV